MRYASGVSVDRDEAHAARTWGRGIRKTPQSATKHVCRNVGPPRRSPLRAHRNRMRSFCTQVTGQLERHKTSVVRSSPRGEGGWGQVAPCLASPADCQLSKWFHGSLP